MPSYAQAQAHYAFMEDQAREQARLAAEARAQAGNIDINAMNQQAANQAQRDSQLAGYQQYQAAQQAQLQGQLQAQQNQYGLQHQGAAAAYGAIQSDLQNQQQAGLMNQQAQIHAQQAVQHVDLQAQYNQVVLTQQEAMRMQRLRNGITDVQNHPGLSQDEKQNLILQLQTGLDPLVQRQHQANILQTQIQTQGAFQNNQMQATLFNQHQEWLARGIPGQIQTVTDPNTGYRQLFHVDSQGRISPLDFSQSQERHRMEMDLSGIRGAQGIQGIQQSRDLFPGQLLQQGATLGQTQANTALTREQVLNIQQMRPHQVAALIASTSDTETRRQIALALAPHQISSMDAQTYNLIGQADERWRNGPLQRDLLGAQANHMDADAANLRARTTAYPLLAAAQLDETQSRTAHNNAVTAATEANTARDVPHAMVGQFIQHAFDSVASQLSNPASAINLQAAQQFPTAGLSGQALTDAQANRRNFLQRYAQDEPARRVRASINAFRQSVAPQATPRAPGVGTPPPNNGAGAGGQAGSDLGQQSSSPAPSGQALLDQFSQGSQGAQLPENPQAASTHEGVRGTAADIYNQRLTSLNAFQRITESQDTHTTLYKVGQLHDILQRASRANRDLTDTERDHFNHLRQELLDRRTDPFAQQAAEQIRLPGARPSLRGTVQQLTDLRAAINHPDVSNAFSGLHDRAAEMSRILQRAISAGRGLTAREASQYESLRAQYAGQTNYRRWYSQTALPGS